VAEKAIVQISTASQPYHLTI